MGFPAAGLSGLREAQDRLAHLAPPASAAFLKSRRREITRAHGASRGLCAGVRSSPGWGRNLTGANDRRYGAIRSSTRPPAASTVAHRPTRANYGIRRSSSEINAGLPQETGPGERQGGLLTLLQERPCGSAIAQAPVRSPSRPRPLLPEPLEVEAGSLRVSGRVSDVDVSEVVLDQTRIAASVRQVVARTVP